MDTEFYFTYAEPLVCTAIHNGHEISPEINENLAITEKERLREEDPRTGYFTEFAANRIVQQISRFEYDTNRAREKAFYLNPEDSWGLKTRKEHPDKSLIKATLQKYDSFYNRTEQFLRQMGETFDHFFVYDIHSYNHHRLGPNEPFDPVKNNPEIILGTSNMPEDWFPLVEKIRNRLQKFDFQGRKLDVRINVKFPGGNFPRWLHSTFPNKACCIALEFKKIFMNEWSGEFYPEVMKELRNALETTREDVFKYLEKKRKK